MPSPDPLLRPPPPPVTAGIVVAIGALVAATIAGRSEPGSPWLAFDIAAGMLALALVPVLLRWPVPGALALAVIAAVSAAATPPATVGTLTVAERRPLAVAVGVGIAGTAAHAVQGFLRPMEGLPYGWFLVLDVIAHAALVASGAFTRARRQLLESLRERARRAESEQAERIAAARTHERTLIAREMHDVLAHRLSLVAASAGALEYRPDAAPDQVARAAGVVRAGVHLALEELRAVIGVLRSDGTDAADRPQPVLADLPALIAECRDAGAEITWHDDVTDPEGAPDGVGRAAYRIVQEGLTNARKHAPGQPVEVTIGGGPGGGLTIDIRNGLPERAPRALPGGTGLVGLAERAALAGGTLTHSAGSGQFVLHATLPWPA